MSVLERISIRGIRNFGVDAEDEQKITFSTPLTLILGQNGSGKTTIIECIKYALTGELPPNCKNGVGFINSPDVLHISESLGQVKLRLKNLRNVETTICRAAKVLKKKNQNPKFKSLEATITLNENGREISTSKRNIDATEDMCTALGVSKAIINHVLFCHQEEANWPLGTDAELMSKFDQIFGTTEYNNALDKMRASRKKYETIVKDKKVNLKEMEMIKQEADRKNMEINKHEDEMKQMKENYEQCKVKLKPLGDQYKEDVKIRERLSSITAIKTKAETELSNQQENARQLSLKIKEIFTGSETDLEEEINLFNVRKLQKRNELGDKEAALSSSKQELGQITGRVDECDRTYHSLLKDRGREQDLCAERGDYIAEMCEKLDIRVDFDIKNCNDRAVGLVGDIKTGMAKVNEKIKEIVAHNEKVDIEQEKQIQLHRGEEVRIKSEIKSINQQTNDLDRALGKQKEELRMIERSGHALKEVRAKIAQIQSVSDELTAQTNTQGLKGEITGDRENKEKLSNELEEIDEQITVISSMATILAEVATKEKHIEKRESEVRRIKNKHNESLKRLFPDENVEANFKRKIETLGQHLRTDTNRLEAEIRLKENHVQGIRAQLETKKPELVNLEKEQRKFEEAIYKECEHTPFADVLAATKDNVEKYQMEYSTHKSSDGFYKNYIKKMQAQPCCPLCHKDMNRNEIGDLTTELSDKIEMLPSEINRTEQLLQQAKIKLEKLLGMQMSVERVEKLQSTLIPKVKADIRKLESELSAAQEKIKSSQRDVEEPRTKLNLVTPMIGDMSILDEALRDIEQTRIDLQPLQSGFQDGEGQAGYNLPDLQKKRKELTENIKKLEKAIERKDKRCQDAANSILDYKNTIMKLKESELKLQGDIQKSDALKTRENELNEEIKQLKEKIEKCNHSLIPIEGKIKNAEENRRYSKSKGSEELNKETKRNDMLKKKFNDIDRVSRELEELATRNLAAEIERTKNALNLLKSDQSKQNGVIDSIRTERDVLTKEIAEHQNTERQQLDNLELKRIQKKINEKQKELETLRKDEQEVDFDQISEKISRLTNEIDKLRQAQVRIEGQMKEKHTIIEDLRAQTNQPKYRDSIRNYKMAYYENTVLHKTIEDLTTYCETLEKALTKFHSDKMEKINSVIRDLWRNIYRGNDIDYIQINTEEVKGTAKRRSYTYRVVASKNDTFMDFRGQSSAGQRVLACLIIRIALAETFSGHCGVLALDEPTTNLDRLNIEALCEALNRIVEERAGQSNFMLIVITHDEDFISALGRVMSYYRVGRDSNGKSKTEKLRVN